jgi:hypothetical protein
MVQLTIVLLYSGARDVHLEEIILGILNFGLFPDQ